MIQMARLLGLTVLCCALAGPATAATSRQACGVGVTRFEAIGSGKLTLMLEPPGRGKEIDLQWESPGHPPPPGPRPVFDVTLSFELDGEGAKATWAMVTVDGGLAPSDGPDAGEIFIIMDSGEAWSIPYPFSPMRMRRGLPIASARTGLSEDLLAAFSHSRTATLVLVSGRKEIARRVVTLPSPEDWRKVHAVTLPAMRADYVRPIDQCPELRRENTSPPEGG